VPDGRPKLQQEADIADGSFEFSMNRRPDLQRPFCTRHIDPEFTREVAAIGIDLVSRATSGPRTKSVAD
jgi:hypothetical protein